MVERTTTCPSGITDATLSAWRDGLLPAAPTRTLRNHLRDCASCKARMRGFDIGQRALRDQQTPDLQHQIWRNLQSRMHQPHPAMPLARWGAISGVLVVLIVTVLFASTLTNAGKSHPISTITGTVTKTSTMTPFPTDAPTATALPAPISPDQAWGIPNGPSISIGAQNLSIGDIAPDGAGIAVVDDGSQNQSRIMWIALPSHVQTMIASIPALNDAPNVQTDGRYIAWVGGLNFTGGPGPSTFTAGYYDLVTGKKTVLYTDSRLQYEPRMLAVEHGTMFVGRYLSGNTSQVGLVAINMQTGTQRTLATNASLGYEISVSWPWVLCFSVDLTSGGSVVHLINATTGATRDYAQFVSQSIGGFNSIQLVGTTIYWTFASHPDVQITEIDHADQPGAILRTILDPKLDTQLGIFAANNRLLIWSDQSGAYAWDTLQHRVIRFNINASQGVNILLHGHTLGYQVGNGAQATFVLRDTDTLPAH